jgi:hypothetical protein
MIEWLLHPAHTPFTVALGLLILLLVLEILSVVLGFAFSSSIDAAFDLDADVSVDVPTASPATAALDWLNVGAVPLVFLAMIFLACFAAAGFTLQTITVGAFNPYAVSIPALLISLFPFHWLGGLAAKHVFKDDSTAVSEDSLIGHTATIMLGETYRGFPSQAKLTDQHGQDHYVQVEPYHDRDHFASGSEVVLVKRDGAKYYVIEESVEALLSLDHQELPAENRQQS